MTGRKVLATLPAAARAELEGRLPDWLEPRWFADPREALELGADAEIGWLDMNDKRDMANAIVGATRMHWLNSMFAGIDGLPLRTLLERGVAVTNGAGLNAVTIAEYVLMGMLTIAKGYREIVRAQERREWLADAPGKLELAGSRALLIGHGAIGSLVHERVAAFGVDVTVARRKPDVDAHGPGPDDWRGRLGEFDWVVLTVPATPQTKGMFGAVEIAALKPNAVLVNVGRASVIDQAALVAALQARRIAGAFLDVTDPEPLPRRHPLLALENVIIAPHLGSATEQTRQKMAEISVENLRRGLAGQPLLFEVRS